MKCIHFYFTFTVLCEYYISIVGGKHMKEVLKLENISKTYQAKNGETEAVKDIILVLMKVNL